MPLRPAWLDVGKTLAAVEATIRPLADEKALTLVTHVSSDVPLLYTDEGRFKQVVDNLLADAVKFTPRGDGSRRARAESARSWR